MGRHGHDPKKLGTRTTRHRQGRASGRLDMTTVRPGPGRILDAVTQHMAPLDFCANPMQPDGMLLPNCVLHINIEENPYSPQPLLPISYNRRPLLSHLRPLPSSLPHASVAPLHPLLTASRHRQPLLRVAQPGAVKGGRDLRRRGPSPLPSASPAATMGAWSRGALIVAAARMRLRNAPSVKTFV
jgi:hypothetical protein